MLQSLAKSATAPASLARRLLSSAGTDLKLKAAVRVGKMRRRADGARPRAVWATPAVWQQ
jgi:hypothetical protein